MTTLQLILVVMALILGIAGVVEGRGRNWAGWGVILLAWALLWRAFQ